MIENEKKSLLDVIVSCNDQTVKLSKTSPLSSFERFPEVHATIKDALSRGIRRYDHMATFINAVFTHQTSSFMTSRTTFSELLKKDKNHKTNAINGDNWKFFFSDIINSSKLIVVVEPPLGKSPGFYKINEANPIFEVLINNVGRSLVELKYKQNYDYFKDNIMKNRIEPMSEEDTKELVAKASKVKGANDDRKNA